MLAAGISLVLFIWLLHSATDARARLGASTVILQEQAARLEADATALEHIRGAPLPLLSSKDLRAVLQARIDAAGLGRTLVRLVADNPDQAQMVLGSIAFVDWLAFGIFEAKTVSDFAECLCPIARIKGRQRPV